MNNLVEEWNSKSTRASIFDALRNEVWENENQTFKRFQFSRYFRYFPWKCGYQSQTLRDHRGHDLDGTDQDHTVINLISLKQSVSMSFLTPTQRIRLLNAHRFIDSKQTDRRYLSSTSSSLASCAVASVNANIMNYDGGLCKLYRFKGLLHLVKVIVPTNDRIFTFRRCL